MECALEYNLAWASWSAYINSKAQICTSNFGASGGMRDLFGYNRELKDFKVWLEKKSATGRPALKIDDSMFQQKSAQDDLFWEQARQRIAAGESCYICLEYPQGEYSKMLSLLKFCSSSDRDLHKIIVNWLVNVELVEIQNAGIRKICLRSSSGGHIKFANCWIDDMTIDAHQQNESGDLHIRLENCWIGKLSFAGGSVRDLIISGGGILAIECPNPATRMVFSGDVVIRDNVFLPKKDGIYKRKKIGFQPWSNAREQLAKLGNINAASKFHSVQLRLERPSLPTSLWIVSWAYDIFSDFGNSIVRPFVWLCAFWIASFSAWFFTTARPAGDACASGFCLATSGAEFLDRLWLALLLATKPVLAPIGVPGTEVAGITIGPGGMLVELLYRLTVLVLLLFIGIALRRRFRVA